MDLKKNFTGEGEQTDRWTRSKFNKRKTVWKEEAHGAQVKTLWVTVAQRGIAPKCLSQARSRRQKDEPEWGVQCWGLLIFLITKTSSKAG